MKTRAKIFFMVATGNVFLTAAFILFRIHPFLGLGVGMILFFASGPILRGLWLSLCEIEPLIPKISNREAMRQLDRKIMARRTEILEAGDEQHLYIMEYKDAITFLTNDEISQNILDSSTDHSDLIGQLKDRRGRYQFNSDGFRRWGFDLRVS